MSKYNGMKYARDWVGRDVVLAREIGTDRQGSAAG